MLHTAAAIKAWAACTLKSCPLVHGYPDGPLAREWIAWWLTLAWRHWVQCPAEICIHCNLRGGAPGGGGALLGGVVSLANLKVAKFAAAAAAAAADRPAQSHHDTSLRYAKPRQMQRVAEETKIQVVIREAACGPHGLVHTSPYTAASPPSPYPSHSPHTHAHSLAAASPKQSRFCYNTLQKHSQPSAA